MTADPIAEWKSLLRASRGVLLAIRPPSHPGSNGIGVDVNVLGVGEAFEVSVERFRADGGYGQRISREVQTFSTLEAALAFVAQQDIAIDELSLRSTP